MKCVYRKNFLNESREFIFYLDMWQVKDYDTAKSSWVEISLKMVDTQM